MISQPMAARTVLFSMFTIDEAAVSCNHMLAIQTELMYTVTFYSWALSSKQLPAVPADCTVCQSAVPWADQTSRGKHT